MWKIVSAAEILVLSTAAAEAETCGKRADLVTALASRHSESPTAIGLASNGGLLEVLTTGDGATWSIILTMPNGTSSLMAVGEAWQSTINLALEDLRA